MTNHDINIGAMRRIAESEKLEVIRNINEITDLETLVRYSDELDTIIADLEAARKEVSERIVELKSKEE